MAEARLRFGTKSSADVKLFLTDPCEVKYVRNPVYLHSQILKRFKCFEGEFSNRWSPYKSTEIWVTTSHNFDHYLKCIEIMYGEHVSFPNIEECLAILSAASEMLADECINKCMQYLEAVRWSAERLHQEDDDHINFVEKSIQGMMLYYKSSSCSLSKNRETAEKDLRGILEGNTSRDVVDVCGRVVFEEFKASIDSRDFSTLKLLFNLIQDCDGGILEAALKAFCEDAEFVKSVKEQYCGPNSFFCSGLTKKAVKPVKEYSLRNTFGCSALTDETVFDIIMRFIKATGEGKIVISRASRVALLTTWLPIMGTFRCNGSLTYKFEELDREVLKVVESLPQVDQKRIWLLWAQVYRLNNIDIATPLTLSKFLLA